MLALAVRYKQGELTFAQYIEAVTAANLPPHRFGCAYVISPVPAPPPGVPFNPAQMPPDWKGTFGEVAMTYWAGALTYDEYDAVHRAAHRQYNACPNCRLPAE